LKATAILPVKRFAAAKQRLAAGLPGERRRALAEAMLEDTLEAIGGARSIERTIVVTDEPRAADAARARGAEAVPEPAAPGQGDAKPGASGDEQEADPGGPEGAARGSHSRAVLVGIAYAEQLDAECVVLLPGDCPLLDPRELDRLLTGLPASYVAVVPDRHGTGTNALALSPPRAIRPAFGEGSCARHVAAAREAGVPFAVEKLPSLALDLDTPADVVALTRELAERPGRARRTAKALGI